MATPDISTKQTPKRGRTSDSSSPQAKDKKKKGECCPICLEQIVDANQKNRKCQDAIYCEGTCDAWLHRRCAGLSKTAFTLLQNTSTPFHFPHYQLKSYELIISNLKLNMATLEKKVTSLEEQLEAMKGPAPCLTDPVAGDSQNRPAISQN